MALAAILVASLAARDAAVSAMANHYPTLATKLAPANAAAIVKVFDQAISSGELHQNFAGWIDASKRALHADPVNAKGLRLLAYATDMTPKGHSRARAIMRLSERASRRDLLAQLWLIEDAVQRDSIADALKHYDRALSVHPAVGGRLIPILVSASREPPIQAALVPYLRANRSWVAPFLSVAVAKASDPTVTVELFKHYGGAQAVPSHAEFETQLIQRLVETGKEREGYAFALASGAELGVFTFSDATIDARFRPFTWTLYGGGDGQVSLDDRGGLAVNVRPEMKIVAASRIILARPGEKVLTHRVSFPDVSAAPLVTWTAYCQREGGPERFWTRDIPVAATPTRVEAPLTVPDGCSRVQIDLEATGSEASAGSGVTIDQVNLATR